MGINTATVLERNTAVIAEDEAGVTLAALHTVLSAPWLCTPTVPHACFWALAHT